MRVGRSVVWLDGLILQNILEKLDEPAALALAARVCQGFSAVAQDVASGRFLVVLKVCSHAQKRDIQLPNTR